MTLKMQDHIHLDTVNPPVDEYKALFESYEPNEMPMVEIERSITGRLHPHRLIDSGGDVVQLNAHKLDIITAGTTTKNTLVRMCGEIAYYVSNWHDDDVISDYVVPCVVQLNGIATLNPIGEYWTVSIEILDNSI